jgi:hypothetical protein
MVIDFLPIILYRTKINYLCMSKLNLIAIVSIVAAVSLIVGMAAPVFAQGNTTSAPAAGNMSGMSMGNSSSTNSTSAAGNATSAPTNSTK